MAEGLFDGRYRYDYIYPRGRSGETLRAVDTHNGNRPVVIKRPAPNDAPPIRAGQEVSIIAERDALRRLTGHPVLTELVADGHYIVGGTTHRYIVMERATGDIIADTVFALAERGERLPLLEMLVVIDHLLDLLQTAHSRDIVYNDVDAKHLFWSRDNYQLKVIDWGNTVFLEGDSVTPSGVSKQSDVYQVGELLYFILTGGGRADVPRDADNAWIVNFGDDAADVPPDLARITSTALHPNPRYRYTSIGELRRDLATVRKPLETERNGILAQVNERLRRDRSKDELHALMRTLQPALDMDSGYPAARDAQAEIEAQLTDLQISADLDAARIYLEAANWHGAADILGELKGNARGETLKIVRLLFDWSVLMLEDEHVTVTPAIETAIDRVFDGEWERAAHTLIMADAADERTYRIHMRLAERVTSHMPDVVLLRPNLYRLGEALATLDGTDGVRLTEQRELLDEIHIMLDNMGSDENAVSMVKLRDTYRGIVDRLSAMTTLMEAVNLGWGERRLPLSSLQRAQNAAMNLADNMHVIGKQAAGTPREALGALDNSRAIDPTNPAWDKVETLLNDLYKLLQSYQTYVPMADGSDLEAWLEKTRRELAPYLGRLFDEMLIGMNNGLKIAAEQWNTYDDHVIGGNRVASLKVLAASAEAVGTVSPTLAGWFNQLRSVINGADYIERHALTGGLGRALADGWQAFDRGRLTDAERLAAQAEQIARTDYQKAVVKRLRALTETVRGWTERNGYLSAERTNTALERINGLYTEEENAVRRRFNAQMPAKDTYLKAMGKGLVEVYGMHSTAAPHILFIDYVLQGAADAHDSAFDDVPFWVEAAERTLEKHGAEHPALKTLHELVSRRQDLLTLSEQFNALGGPETIANIDDIRAEFEAHPRAKIIGEAVHALREVENALPDWSNAEFRTAGMKLDNAVKAAKEATKTADIDLNSFIGWLETLSATAARLHTIKLNLQDRVEERPDYPQPELSAAHEQLVRETLASIGEPYVTTLSLWDDTYRAFADVMLDESSRRSAKLTAFNDLFRAMFIDRHPAYPLYRHWFDLTERSPEFPAPPTAEPQPRITEDDDFYKYDDEPETEPTLDDSPPIPSKYDEDATPPRPRRRGPLQTGVLVLVGVAVLAIGGVALNQLIGNSEPPPIAVTISPTPTENATTLAQAVNTTTPAAADMVTEPISSATPTPDEAATTNALATLNALNAQTATAVDTVDTEATATNAQPTLTPTLTDVPITATPTASPTPSNTPTPTVTPTPENTPTPTLPPNGLTGEINLLPLLARVSQENPPAAFWEADRFSNEGESWRLGIGADTPATTLALMPPPVFFATYLGGDAPARLAASEVTLALATFNPLLLTEEAEGVSFGMLLAPAGSQTPLTEGVGINIDVIQPGVVNIGVREGDDVDVVSQRALNAVIVRFRLERTSDGRVQTYFNGEPLGIVGGNTEAGAPLAPVLYVTDGGVIVNVTEWRVLLR